MIENGWLDEAPCWINGEGRTLAERMEVIDPSNGERIGNVPLGGAKLAEEAATAAWGAFPIWSSLLPRERSRYLMRWAESILQHQEELAHLLTREQGKPLAESMGELEGAASFVQWYAEEAKRVSGEVLPPHQPKQCITVIRQPVGVAALITPWNYPAAMVTRKTAPALAAGCTVVLKPAKQTPLIAVALFRLLMETGLPAGAANLVTGEASAIGKTWLEDPRVRKISFTGSTEVGKKLMQQAARQVKRVSLELGGNAPAIVFKDADLERTATAIVDNKFENCGQMCNGINRIYAEEAVAEELTDQILAQVKEKRVGPGVQPSIHIGPLIHDSARQRVHRLVTDAVEKGARLRLGGHPLTEGVWGEGVYYAPTVLTDVDHSMALTREEVFGPVAPILSFQTEEEVMDQANQTSYGLAAYLFTRDAARIQRVSEKLEFGMVGVNGTSLSVPQAPFGGIKESGMGREGGRYGLEEFLELKYIAMLVD